MLRIFQTGDNHIGLKYASHEQKEQLITARINTFADMVAIANREECALFVITGDLFESTSSATKKDIKKLLAMLAGFRGTVVVIPGNHDFYDENAKVWQHFKALAAEYDNIMLLTEYRPYTLTVDDDEVVLYPAHCTSLHSEAGKNNLDWLKAEQITTDGSYRIGIAHGAVQGETIDKEGQYFLMSRQELERIPVDVWLVGHTHVPFPRNLTEEFTVCERILNAGTHVQTDVACNTEGLCFIVEIAEDKTVRAKKVKTGKLHFYRRQIALQAGEMEAILDRTLADMGDNSVVDLILAGAVTGDEYDNRHDIIMRRLSRFLESSYNDSALSKLISKALIDAEFAETSLSGKLLTALLDDSKEAQLAYDLLQLLKEGR